MEDVFFESGPEHELLVVDPIDRHRYALSTPEPMTPTPVDADAFRFPVDTAVSVRTDAFSLPNIALTYVRDEGGEVCTRAEHFANEHLPRGTYTIEVSAPLKLYLEVESTVDVTADGERTSITFGEETRVLVGARSHHSHPAATVRTPADPENMMAAVSTFGSALKTTSSERSYPTLRGHPPTVELGEDARPRGAGAPGDGDHD